MLARNYQFVCLLFNDYKTVQGIRGLFKILPISIIVASVKLKSN